MAAIKMMLLQCTDEAFCKTLGVWLEAVRKDSWHLHFYWTPWSLCHLQIHEQQSFSGHRRELYDVAQVIVFLRITLPISLLTSFRPPGPSWTPKNLFMVLSYNFCSYRIQFFVVLRCGGLDYFEGCSGQYTYF